MSHPNAGAFKFADLFAGIGGFHATLTAAGGECWFASDIDPACREVYEHNWGFKVASDIVPLTENTMKVPVHDVLAAGFPCQPFSKSGHQRGMAETRGTLFFNICRILEERRPSLILLENVRNLAGPRQRDTWRTIVRSLRDLGYRVSDKPAVFSPHLLPSEMGGTPQVRERVFITGTYVGAELAWADADVEPVVSPEPVDDWDPQEWDLVRHLPLDDYSQIENLDRYKLADHEVEWLDTWNAFLEAIEGEKKLPTFPIWADAFESSPSIPRTTPAWKANFLRKNSDLYRRHRSSIDAWLRCHGNLDGFPSSRRKFEWQAQDGPRDVYEHVIHLRPSGIRVKRATYLPALVAITQTSVYGPQRRRITPREAARLQGLPDWFDFGDQGDALTYRQLGNGISIGAAYYVLSEHVRREQADLPDHIVNAVLQAAPLPVIPQRNDGGTVTAEARESYLAGREVAVGGNGEVVLQQDRLRGLVNS